jgi:serine/threonine protein kinase
MRPKRKVANRVRDFFWWYYYSLVSRKRLTSTKFNDPSPSPSSWRPRSEDLNQVFVRKLAGILRLPLDQGLYIPWDRIDVPAAETPESIVLGRGSQAETFRATFNGRVVAVKLGHQACILSEALFATAINHPSVIHCIGWTAVAPTSTTAEAVSLLDHLDSVEAMETSGWVFAGIYELCENMDLERFLTQNPDLRSDISFLARTFDSVLSALEKFEEYQVLHGDVKCDNVLIDGALRAKVSDLAMCQAVRGTMRKKFFWNTSTNNALSYLQIGKNMDIVGTPSFLSPEQCADWFGISTSRNRVYNTKTDMFSFGCLVARAVSGEFPFQRLTLRLKRKSGFKTRLDLLRHFSISLDVMKKVSQVHPVFTKLVQLCTNIDPQLRPTPAAARELLRPLL